MARIRHIDDEAYAQKALELLNERREGFISRALEYLRQGLPQGEAAGKLDKKVKDEMETVLFHYLERSGAVRGEYRHRYCPATGLYRSVRSEPHIYDVPPDLLDIAEVFPGYSEFLGNVMVEAEKRRIVEKIETVTQEANAGSS